MLPAPPSAGALEAGIVEREKISRDDRKQAEAYYMFLLGARSIVFQRKFIPSRVTADDEKVLVEGVHHMRITVVFEGPAKNH